MLDFVNWYFRVDVYFPRKKPLLIYVTHHLLSLRCHWWYKRKSPFRRSLRQMTRVKKMTLPSFNHWFCYLSRKAILIFETRYLRLTYIWLCRKYVTDPDDKCCKKTFGENCCEKLCLYALLSNLLEMA